MCTINFGKIVIIYKFFKITKFKVKFSFSWERTFGRHKNVILEFRVPLIYDLRKKVVRPKKSTYVEKSLSALKSVLMFGDDGYRPNK